MQLSNCHEIVIKNNVIIVIKFVIKLFAIKLALSLSLKLSFKISLRLKAVYNLCGSFQNLEYVLLHLGVKVLCF